ncbi:coiled-coil domain-containing protein 93-like [Acanthaster planci]|uniref:Coiled-coil domain-containing protein 93 n=1 Tax=Acanthaster planci TaxID=133434 RepID=A0A8B7XJ02_ACAPL|nr:coiled-coil domain-containing protein 93-like [Acanthaster planci]
MAAPSGSVFHLGRSSSSKLGVVYDTEGREVEVETREDEEQNVKLQETIELLLAAGYFRARIKGLTPFDKVVGGMTWCITTCNFDIDVDLLFQENSTIGQKIALTEKIVAVLPRMKCPHRIEPHQIQGLDFIHIYPVVQWLVKRAIETREEMGDLIRAFSISQFNKQHQTPEDVEFEGRKNKSVDTISIVKDVYKPQRRYRRADAHRMKEEEMRVQSTLLEYGRRYGISRTAKSEKDAQKEAKKKALEAGMTKARSDSLDSEESQEREEKRIQALMKGMSISEEGKVTASTVGSIVGLQSEEIGQIASEYADKKSELQMEAEKPERMSGAQQHQRMVASLNKQIANQEKKLAEVSTRHSELKEAHLGTQSKLQEVQEQSRKIDKEMEDLESIETDENKSVLQKLRSLVAMNESLKKQEQEFRTHCKEEMVRLQETISGLKENEGEAEMSERDQMILKRYEAGQEKLQKLRLLLARKTREIAALQRKIDDVPSRAELSQYQRRFVELYNQVANTHKETKQFYTLYNTLDDTKLYVEKEITLLNSIHDNFSQAMNSTSNKEQFLRQFEQIVGGVKQNKIKVEKKKQEEKMRRDQLNDNFLDLVEKQRLYFKTVRDFKEECRKNEILLSKLSATN